MLVQLKDMNTYLIAYYIQNFMRVMLQPVAIQRLEPRVVSKEASVSSIFLKYKPEGNCRPVRLEITRLAVWAFLKWIKPSSIMHK